MSRTNRQPYARPSAHVLTVALAALIAMSTGCAGKGRAATGTAGEPAMSAFQWAVSTDASLFFVPRGEHLYAARKSEPGVLESIPPKVLATVLGEADSSTFLLSALMSPYDVDRRHWVMQRRVDGRWEDLGAYRFDGDAFVLADDEKIHSYDFETIRFRPRG